MFSKEKKDTPISIHNMYTIMTDEIWTQWNQLDVRIKILRSMNSMKSNERTQYIYVF